MRAADVRVGGTYTARVGGRFTTVRIDRIIDQTTWRGKACTTYAVTNLATGRETTFRSAAKFRSEVATPVAERVEVMDPLHPDDAPEGMGHGTPCQEDEQCSDPIQSTTAPSVRDVVTCANGASAANGIAARIAELSQPTATGLTQQQQDILTIAREIEGASGQRVLVIKAGAGTGKTFTLKQLEGILRGNGQYTARNTKLVQESKAKFQRAACNTTYSLAFRAVGCRFQHRLGGKRVRSWEVAQRLGIQDFTVELPTEIAPPESDGQRQTRRLKASFLAGQVMAAVTKFCVSADREIGTKHIRRFDGIDAPDRHDNSNMVKEYLLPFLHKAWADLTDPRGDQMPFSHDVYVKIWEMGRDGNRPVIAADYILLDEGQDTAPVMLSILEQQTHAMLIMVGDDNQQIYEWAGAINALAHFRAAPVRQLSQSFRFGQTVADVANSVLAGMEQPTDLVMTGNPAIPSRICSVVNPRCYLYRTNAGAIGRLMRGLAEGKRGYITGPVDAQISFCKAAIELQAGRGTTHAELGCFEKWSEVQDYVKEDEGADLKLMVKLVDDFTPQQIIRALENMPSEKDADFVCSTAHRSKGLEWTSVRLGQDFKTADKLTDEERRLLYVAATRAQEELDVTQCPTFCGGYSKGGNKGGDEIGSAGQGEWIPGITINYTVDMPTAEALAAYRSAKLAAQPIPVGSLANPPTQMPGVSANGNPARPAAPAPSGEAVRQMVASTTELVVTYTKLPSGEWGLWASGAIREGEMVTVRTRTGVTKRERIGKIVVANAEAKKWLATIDR